MARLLKINDIFSVKAWCTDAEQASVNTWFFAVDTVVIGVATDLSAAMEFDALVAPLLKALLPASVTYNGVQVQVVEQLPTTIFKPVAQSSTAGAGAGEIAGTGLPRQSCGLISWQTPNAGAAYRGRTYLPFPATGSDGGIGAPGPIYLGNAEALATDLQGKVNLSGGDCVISMQLYRRPDPRNIPPIPYQVTPITEWSVSTRWATQRRRGSFGRANLSPI